MTIKKYFFIICITLQSITLLAKDYPVSLFGIRSDGTTLNTSSIQFAINYISENGGGSLVFRAGSYLTGTIHLKSNVTLQLEEGSVILGSLNPFDYERDKAFQGLIVAYGQENIAIMGKGMIDGQGKYVARNYVNCIEKGLIKDSYTLGRPGARPMAMYLRECKNIKITGVTFKNPAFWNQTYDQCKNLTIDSIIIDGTNYWNNDGIDIVDSDTVSVTNCFIDAADDGICLKSHEKNSFCNNIYIANNTVRSSANGIKFGTVAIGGFRNIKIINNTVYDTFRSAVALESVDGGFLEDVVIDGLKVFNSGNLIFLRIGERHGKGSSLKRINISNVYAEIPAGKPDAGYSYEGPTEDLPRNISPAIIITGQPGLLVSDVVFKNFEIRHAGGGNALYADVPLNKLHTIPEMSAKYPDFSMFKELPSWAGYIRHAKGIEFSNMQMKVDKADSRVPIVLDDVHDSKFSNLKIDQIVKKKEIFQNKSSKIEIN